MLLASSRRSSPGLKKLKLSAPTTADLEEEVKGPGCLALRGRQTASASQSLPFLFPPGLDGARLLSPRVSALNHGPQPGRYHTSELGKMPSPAPPSPPQPSWMPLVCGGGIPPYDTTTPTYLLPCATTPIPSPPRSLGRNPGWLLQKLPNPAPTRGRSYRKMPTGDKVSPPI